MAMVAETLAHERDMLPRARSTADGADRARTAHPLAALLPGRKLLGAAAVAAGIAAAATVIVGGSRDVDAAAAAGDPRTIATAAPSDPTDATVPTTTSAPAPGSPAPAAPATTTAAGARPPATADNPGAPTAATNRIVHRGVAYELGGAGDVAAVVDPTCAGDERAVLLRPATGELFTFDGWASAGAEQPARLVTRVPGALTVAVTTSAACGSIDVILGDGSTVTIDGKELR